MANKISTPGYEQHPYTIWFMYEGSTPADVKGISKMSVDFVKTGRMKNITAFENNEYQMGFGSNINTSSSFYPTILIQNMTTRGGIQAINN